MLLCSNLGQLVHTQLPRLGAFSIMNLSRSSMETREQSRRCRHRHTTSSLYVVVRHRRRWLAHTHRWLALRGVQIITCSQQPPEQPTVSHINCFSQCKIVRLQIIHNCLHVIRGPPASPIFWLGCSQNLLGIATAIRWSDMHKQRKTTVLSKWDKVTVHSWYSITDPHGTVDYSGFQTSKSERLQQLKMILKWQRNIMWKF